MWHVACVVPDAPHVSPAPGPDSPSSLEPPQHHPSVTWTGPETARLEQRAGRARLAGLPTVKAGKRHVGALHPVQLRDKTPGGFSPSRPLGPNEKEFVMNEK